MAKDPEKRFQSADEFRNALAGVDPAERPAPRDDRRPQARKPLWLAAAPAVVLLLTAGLAAIWRIGPTESPAAPEQETAQEELVETPTAQSAPVEQAGLPPPEALAEAEPLPKLVERPKEPAPVAGSPPPVSSAPLTLGIPEPTVAAISPPSEPRETPASQPLELAIPAEEPLPKMSPPVQRIRSVAADGPVWAVALSADGRWMAAATGQNTVRVWDTATGEEIAAFRGHTERIVALSFSPNGNFLASGSRDRTAKLWDLAAKRERATLGHGSGVVSVSFSPNGRWLASGTSDRKVNLWDLASKTPVAKLEGHKREPQALAFNPASPMLVTVSSEKSVRLWTVPTNQGLSSLPGPDQGANAVAFSPDGRRLAVAGLNHLKLWDVESWREVRSLDMPGWLHALAFARDGRCLALSATPDAVKLWDVSNGRELSALPQERAVQSLALSRHGNRVATAGENGSVSIWEVRP